MPQAINVENVAALIMLCYARALHVRIEELCHFLRQVKERLLISPKARDNRK